jgi:hypothetical protein
VFSTFDQAGIERASQNWSTFLQRQQKTEQEIPLSKMVCSWSCELATAKLRKPNCDRRVSIVWAKSFRGNAEDKEPAPHVVVFSTFDQAGIERASQNWSTCLLVESPVRSSADVEGMCSNFDWPVQCQLDQT